MTLPATMLVRLGLAAGALLDVSVEDAAIVLKPRARKARQSGSEHSPDQRRALDARLAESEADIKAGRVFGPFDSVNSAVASMQVELRRRTAARKADRNR